MKNAILTRRMKQSGVVAQNHAGRSATRILQFAGASCAGNTLIGFGRLAMGILSLSLFNCIGAFVTFGMVAARGCALAGAIKEDSTAAQYRYYRLSGILLLISGVFYIAYAARLLFYPVADSYPMNVAIGIAAFAFAELVISISGIIRYRHHHTTLLHAIKMINLASSLTCLVLAQTAILSFTDASSNHAPENGLMGILMGGAAAALGVIMILRINRLHNKQAKGANDGSYISCRGRSCAESSCLHIPERQWVSRQRLPERK